MSGYLSYISVTTLCGIALICLLIWYYRKKKVYSQFPQFDFLPIVLRSILKNEIPKNMTANSYYSLLLVEKLQKFQSDGLCLVWFFLPYLVIYSEEASKVLNNSDATLNRPGSYKVFHEFYGTSLIPSNADVWRKRKKVLKTAFYMSALKSNVPKCNRRAKDLVQKLRETGDSNPDDLLQTVAWCTFSNICEFAVLELNDFENHPDARCVMDTLVKQNDIAVYRLFRPWMQHKYALWFFSKGREFLKQSTETRKFISKMLLELKSSVLSADGNELTRKNELFEEPRLSFALLLVEYHLKDPSFTLKDMVDELVTILSAGYESVTHTLKWCLYLLGLHPDVQSKLYQELETMMEDDLSYEDLSKLPYLNCVIKETLRIYPTAPVYARYLDEDEHVGKYLIPKGTNLIFLPYLLHRDPKVYPNPETFNPERFMEENSSINPWNYTPFAEGKRGCIGKNFALLELKIILAHLIKNFTVFSLQSREDITLKWEIALKTEEKLQIRLQPRVQDLKTD